MKKTLGKINQSAKSGTGKQFLPLDCRAKAHLKGVFLFTAPVVAAPGRPLPPTAVVSGHAILCYAVLCSTKIIHYIR